MKTTRATKASHFLNKGSVQGQGGGFTVNLFLSIAATTRRKVDINRGHLDEQRLDTFTGQQTSYLQGRS